VFGLQLYQGIALYWLAQNIFMICQQWYIVGWGGLKVPRWFPGAGRTTPLSFNAPPEIAYRPQPRNKVGAGTRAAAGNGRRRRRSPDQEGPRRRASRNRKALAEWPPPLPPLGRNARKRPARSGESRGPGGRPRMTQPT